ncbi:MAG: hypothetical protein R3F14_37095 [Polyangiaceae bacterium]
MVAVAALGCTADPPQEREDSAQARSAIAAWQSATLAWGTGDTEVGLRPGATDLPAEGPSSVAVGPSGEVLVLDRVNERAISIATSGASHVRASLARDAEHIAAGEDGAFAAWSPLRAQVSVLGRDGSPAGELSIPRVLRDVQRIEVGTSHRIFAVTSMQETWSLGSPHAPLDLASILRSKREGAAFLADGRGIAARMTDSGGEILVYRSPGGGAGEKTAVAWTYPIAGPLAAVRIIGATDTAFCARIERIDQDPQSEAIHVEREALCVEAGTGKVLAQQPMGGRGLYTMHEDAAVGGSPPVLVVARPEADGLHLTRVALGEKGDLAATEVAR